ncbi:MAG: hypothetical protein ABIN39_06465 [candidate division WOR-3 bacterium]
MKKMIFLFLFVISLSTFSQTTNFGKNKIQYKDYNWKVGYTEHFNIYYYQGAESLFNFVSIVAESSIARLQEEFNYKIKNKIPIVLYNSHKDFEETNITVEILDEFVGGFTESVKNRVVLPFTGSYEDLRHVVNHELVHALQFQLLYEGSGTSAIIGSVVYDIPLWFIEGSAEFYSVEFDEESDMYMRDAILNDGYIDLVTLSSYYGGYYIYKAGQMVLKYISEKYGREKIPEIYKDIKNTKSFYRSLEKKCGINIEKLDSDFKVYLKERYFPLVKERELVVSGGKSVLGDFIKTSNYNVSPSISPDGNYVAFISEKYGYFDIYILPVFNPDKKKKILPRNFVRNYESFHLDYGNLNWSKDSKYLVFSVRAGKDEIIFLYDVEKEKISQKIKINADGVYSPSLDPDNKRIVYTKQIDGRNDICIYDLKKAKEEVLTEDIFDDISPFFYNDSTIIFLSDREFLEGVWNYGDYKLYKLYLHSKRVEKVEIGYKLGKRFYPVNDSLIIFSSYIDFVSDVYLYNLKTKEIRRLTNSVTGLFNPTITSDLSKMTVSYFRRFSMDVILIQDPVEKKYEIKNEKSFNDYVLKSVNFENKKTVYQSKNIPLTFSVDWAAGAFSYSPISGFLGLLDIGISDIMGDNRIYIQMQKLSITGTGYFSLQYWYLKNRLDFAFLYFNLKEEYLYNFYSTVSQSYNGGGILLRYPIDRYKRIDFENDIFKYSLDFNEYYIDTTVVTNIYSSLFTNHILSFIYDNAIWGEYGPVNGELARFDLGFSLDLLTDSSNLSYNGGFYSFDLRKYFVTTPRTQFATKFYYSQNFGPYPMYSYLGGAGSLRGYSDNQFFGKIVGYSNNEWRFPLIDAIKFSFFNIGLYNIRGVVFTDLGFAKDDLKKLRLITSDFLLDDLKLGFGIGVRMNLYLAILKFDIAKNTDLWRISKETYYHLSFGSDF